MLSRIRQNKWILRGGILSVLGGLLLLFGFITKERRGAVCEALVITYPDGALGFAPEDNIRQLLFQRDIITVGSPVHALNLKEIEMAVTSLPHVRQAHVYTTIDHTVVVEVNERVPIARLIAHQGRQALLDKEGHIVPLPDGPSPRLPAISLEFSIQPQWVDSTLKVDSPEAPPVLASVYQFAKMLQDDPFLIAQFQHTLVSKDGEFTVYPQVGNHTISLGTMDEMEWKIEKLKLFYSEGMNAVNWNRFADINLNYKDQIVCTKK